MALRLWAGGLALVGLMGYAVADTTDWGRQPLPARIELIGLPLGFAGLLVLVVGAVLWSTGRARERVRAVGTGLVAAGVIAVLLGAVSVVLDVTASSR